MEERRKGKATGKGRYDQARLVTRPVSSTGHNSILFYCTHKISRKSALMQQDSCMVIPQMTSAIFANERYLIRDYNGLRPSSLLDYTTKVSLHVR